MRRIVAECTQETMIWSYHFNNWNKGGDCVFLLYILLGGGALVLGGLCYDFFKRKSFKEIVNNKEVNQNAERARMDANTSTINNQFYGP